jgi:DegV family protein with EDD domain
MREIAVVTDSAANLPRELAQKHQIQVVPLALRLDERLYRDEIDITATEFYRILREQKTQMATSQPSVGDFLEIYRALGDRFKSILSIHLPPRLSGTMSSALTAARQLPSLSIHVIDSGCACMGQGFVTLAAARMAEMGSSVEEVLREVEAVISKVRLLASLDTLEYIVRGGRLSVAGTLLRPALKIKALLSLQDGKVRFMGLARSREKAIQRLLTLMESQVGDRPVHAAVFHTDDLGAAERLRQIVAERFHCLELYLTSLTPVMGVHAGPGTLGLTYYEDS